MIKITGLAGSGGQTVLRERMRLAEARTRIYDDFSKKTATTTDGRVIKVSINSGDYDSIAAFDPQICDGIGLFRTEFLYMSAKDYPNEETQYNAYKDIAEKANGKEVIIRTLDIGGDKHLHYMDIQKEDNPFLGLRAIRLCLDREDIFHIQLRSILRAAVLGNVGIMFPMIVSTEELLAAKNALKRAQESLKRDGLAYPEQIKIGIMIETPASVFISDIFAENVDFFSIGTNDLIQYITATDRLNEKVQYLYDPYNLSVLRAINTTINCGQAAGISVGMCGEMASDENLLPLLIGMGLDEISVAPSQVGRVKHLISLLNYKDIREMSRKVLELSSVDEIKKQLSQLQSELQSIIYP
jgi:phosphotransferase system enzyme I (PtsI)